MKHLAIILALVCMSATATRAEWRYHKTIDPLDDSEIHLLGCMPTNQTARLELSKPTMLAIRIQNGETIFGIVAMPNTITEKTFPVVIRFDRKKARKIQCKISKDHELLFPPNQKEFLEEILSCNGLIVSLDTAFGRRIDFFDLRGLDRLLRKHNLDLFPQPAQTPEPVERPETREPTPAAEPQTPDPKLVANATASMHDIIQALNYARTRNGPMPTMKKEHTLTKPLLKLKNAIEKREHAAASFETIETRYNNMKPGSISRPSYEQRERARTKLKTADADLTSSVAEIRRLSAEILQSTDWPTPELSSRAEYISARIPRR